MPTPTSPTRVATHQWSNVNPESRRHVVAPTGIRRPAITNDGTPISRERMISQSAVASKRAGRRSFSSRESGRRLHLAHPVEVAHRRRDVLHVRDDDVARNELDEPADDRAKRPEPGGGLRAVEAVAPEALERLDRAPVVDVEPVGPREHLGPRQLRQHLALAR